MRKHTLHPLATQGLALLLLLGAAGRSQSPQTAPAYTYTRLAPVEQYLMPDRAAEIALARSAAPESIARDAEVMVMEPHGFETAVKGTNGFVCIVGRSWTSGPDLWNPKVRVPLCVNAPGRTYLLRILKESEWMLAGRTEAQVTEAIRAGVAGKELPPMAPGSMCYMMSRLGYGGEGVPHWPAHLMFFISDAEPALWGANLPRSPVMAYTDPDEGFTTFVVPVQHWSDGTEYREDSAAEHHHS